MSAATGEERIGHLVYDIEDRPPLREALPLGLQHMVAMFLGNITPPILIATALGLAGGETAYLVQLALVFAGLATLVQAFPLGPVGGRLPMVMGTSFTFLGVVIAVAKEQGLAVAHGACLAACWVEVVMGRSIGQLRKLFPPLVSGLVVVLIGLTLIPVGVEYAAGGPGAPDFGAPRNLALAGVVLVVSLVLNQLTRGLLSYASVLIGVAVGCLVAAPLGVMHLGDLAGAGWFMLPVPGRSGLAFDLGAVLTLAFVYVISAVETMGDITGTTAAVGREPSDAELRGGLIADGVMSGLASLFSSFPTTSYSQNVGLVNFTGVASRYVAGLGGALLLVLGLIPKVGVLVAAIPQPVIGGAGLIMFGMISASGLSVIRRAPWDQRAMVIVALSLGLGLGIQAKPEALAQLPHGVQTFFGTGLIAGATTAVVLNLLLPAADRGEAQVEAEG